MSSCQKKNLPSYENYANPPRSNFDQLMNKMYNPTTYMAAPNPMSNTAYDLNIKKNSTVCPNCSKYYTQSS